MPTYTFGTTPDIEIIARLPHKYHMELNKSDMMHLLHQLELFENKEDINSLATIEKQDEISQQIENQSDWAMQMRTSILTTIGIEEV